MERSAKSSFSRPINTAADSTNFSRSFSATSTYTSSSSSSSPPDLVRRVQAAFKRHRPLGTMPSTGIRPRRLLVRLPEASKDSNIQTYSTFDAENGKEGDAPKGHRLTLPFSQSKNKEFISGENREDASMTPPSECTSTVSAVEENIKPSDDQRGQDARRGGNENVVAEVQKKVHFVTEKNATSREMEWDAGNQLDTSAAVSQERQHHSIQSIEMDDNLRSDGNISSVEAKKPMHSQLGNFLQNDLSNAMTQSSVAGLSCVTSTLIDSTAAPMISSTTYSSHTKINDADNLDKGNAINTKSQSPSSKVLEISKSEKIERGASSKTESTLRKKGYDPDLFFKVNGKLYQRLGKIGSGGSSEVHKVISSDCKIYALKKIKLKGRDYATAYGFCQEMKYLNTLKGKSNIIQLIDYEVTDKTLLQEVMNGSMSIKEGRVKHDGYIYMVLEHGEIDLAHMLAQKWKELEGSNEIIDENWLRFYWQQILQAVNTIHEERVVHSDLKPANFLLVRGSLKLIDFGIAKAIMSDTTNIQRDSQVGTLSYMSPEAFLCNETDANGNTIKCGRPSDIWSLGCILYQMVYGRTPFSEYKTFWAKFKVITDPNHEIIYEPLSNPWLLDLMKKCLAWDRNKRWRIPQLLQHPFLVPPVPNRSVSSIEQKCTLFQLIAESSEDNENALMLCTQLQSMVMDPSSEMESDSPISRDQFRKLLCKISSVCDELARL